jgi:hypothetical protein
VVGAGAGSSDAVGSGAGSGSAVGAVAGSSDAVGSGAGSGSAVGAVAGNSGVVGADAESGCAIGTGSVCSDWVRISNDCIFCYCDSILQCLAHVYLICPQEFKYLVPFSNSLCDSLMRVVRDLSEKKINMESVLKFRNSTPSHLSSSEYERMQDVREILLLLFENRLFCFVFAFYG